MHDHIARALCAIHEDNGRFRKLPPLHALPRSDDSYPKGSPMFDRKAIRPYHHPAGGWGALKAVSEHLIQQHIPLKGAVTLGCMNQPEGFDCPGCAWPDPKHTSSFEFCENGAKAVAWEATSKRCTPEF